MNFWHKNERAYLFIQKCENCVYATRKNYQVRDKNMCYENHAERPTQPEQYNNELNVLKYTSVFKFMVGYLICLK